MSDHIEFGNKYINLHPKDIIYSRGDFYSYADGLWERNETVRKELWSISSQNGAKATASYISSVFDYLREHYREPDDTFDNNPNLICLQNGVLNLSTMKFMKHSANFKFTTQLGFNYDAKAECKQWEQFINQILVTSKGKTDKSMVDFVQEAFGYSLTASTEHEISFWMLGEGANGKSTMLYLLNSLAGSSALHLALGMLDKDRYQLSDIGGKRIIICTEAPETTVAHTILKQIISGDPMNVRAIRGHPFVISPVAKVWWAMNNSPRVDDTSEGFWRKMKVIPFNRIFEVNERDKKLKFKLEKELPGIFNWAIKGLRRLEKEGEFTDCDQIDDATLQYREESNLAKEFLGECTNLVQAGITQTSELYQSYSRWCKDNGYKADSQKRVSADWRRLGLKRGKENGKRVWFGVELGEDESAFSPRK